MLPLLALGLLAAQTRDDSPVNAKTPARLATLLVSLGYALKAEGDERDRGTLTRDAATVDLSINQEPVSEEEGAPRTVTGLSLRIELEFPQEIPFDLRQIGADGRFIEAPVRFIAHLGRTVSASGSVDLKGRPTRGRVRRDLQRFWTTVADYAVSHGGRFVAAKERDWRRERISDAALLTVPDRTSLERATDSWGWHWPGDWFMSGPIWCFPIQVEGREIRISPDISRKPKESQAVLLVAWATLPSNVDAMRWVEREGRRFPWADLSHSNGNGLTALHSIDLGKGLPVGDLRRRIADFAANVDALQREVDAAKP